MKNRFFRITKTPGKALLCHVMVLFFINSSAQEIQNNKKISHSVYFTANTGIDDSHSSGLILKQINEASQSDKEASVVIVGNITPKGGYPPKKKDRKETEDFLKERLMKPLEGFNGNIIYTPGVNEWNKEGHQNLDDMESFLQDNSEAEFWPNDGCPIEGEDLNDDVRLVMVDSQWFLEEWDNHPYINDKCEIKTREQFFIEFKDELKDEQGKTIIVSIHHPVMSNTRHGFINKIAGFTEQSYQNPLRQELRNRLETLSRQFEDVIFVSGNDRNLQYIEDDNTPQIISGALGKLQRSKPEGDKDFASKKTGFVKLNVYKDGSSKVEFYEATASGPQLLHTQTIKRERISEEEVTYHSKEDFGATFKASVYTEKEVNKSYAYKKLWGEHYRQIYAKQIEVPVLFIDTLPGNPVAINEGGGRQSRSLRLRDDNENEFTLREIRKSALRFIQGNIPGHYIYDYMQNTVAERIVQDFYTTAHPYAPFAVNDIMEDLDIYHANPKLYYVPKQENLNIYNEDYGDKLYMLEEHVGDHNKEFEDFGNADDILSTSDLLLELRETKNIYVHEPTYIRARLADMLIGDWDRHEDQWRWAEFKENDSVKMYKPIPRDRDQAFSKYDGLMVRLLKFGFPETRAFQSFKPDLADIKWFNKAAYPLDKAFIRNAKWPEWEEQVKYIQQNLSDEKIEAAFAALPEDTRDASIENIKKALKARRGNLEDIAKRYYKFLTQHDIVTATEKDDLFIITRKPNGITEIRVEGGDGSEFKRAYSSSETKEIWIFGLEGEDDFKVEGEGNDLIKLKIVGGKNNDTYNFDNPRQTKIYDYKSKKNSFGKTGSKMLTDNYDINNYDPTKRKHSTNVLFPSIGFDPDAGFKMGVKNTYTTYGLARNPFTAKHSLSLNYFFATDGFSAEYTGEFAHIFPNWNLGLEAKYTSPNYTLNYFGTGNDSFYDEDLVDMDFNRVRIQQISFAPSLIRENNRGSSFHLKGILESMEVAYNENEFVGQTFDENSELFNHQLYGGAEIYYRYFNQDNPAFPSRGLDFSLTTGYKANIDEHNNKFGYLKPSLGINYPLHSSGIATLATKVGGEMIFGDNYEFYHGATLGGNHSLRAYRNERFNGKTAFFHSTDIRVGLSKVRTDFIPLRFGITAGYDYGRVWSDEAESNDWHDNYGGSIFINGFNALTANFGYYLGDDGNRFMFSLGFNF
ncbi:metallophosphoesterase family protein [Salegentibacter sediminis]|uniref:metallophosphatase n=1 Tax=Salegentibacter sediminis TaxID=1930251 RepID=UPI0012FF78F1|nr:metallophosphatase [Salegentibacter sediminis]